MNNQLSTSVKFLIKSLFKPLIIACLVIALVFSQADGALAAGRSGGRIGGGGFSRPSRPYSPSPTYTQPGGGYYPGGGFGFPFLIPIFGFGGGGLFSILIFIAIATFIARTLRSVAQGGSSSSDGYGGYYPASPNVFVAKVQVGLLAQARSLQTDLDRIAQTADTSSSEGLTLVLQEATLSLLRHPEYWIYAGSDVKQTNLAAAEDQFNRLALAERSKFSEETLSNYNSRLKQATINQALPSAGGELVEADLSRGPAEYIVVTLLVATQGKLEIPAINSSQDLRRALGQIGAVPSDNLLAIEVLWTPQAENDTLSSEDVIVGYPDLKLI